MEKEEKGEKEMKNKKEMLRVLRTPEGEFTLDCTGRKNGRGAYVCPAPACLKKIRKSRALERAFSAPLPDGVWEALEAQMEAGDRDG